MIRAALLSLLFSLQAAASNVEFTSAARGSLQPSGTISYDSATGVIANVGTYPLTYAASVPSRVLGTVYGPFSATQAMEGTYAYKFSCSSAIIGTVQGQITAYSDSTATPSTFCDAAGGGVILGVAVAIANGSISSGSLKCKVLPGHKLRLVSTGTCTTTLIGQREVLLGP